MTAQEETIAKRREVASWAQLAVTIVGLLTVVFYAGQIKQVIAQNSQIIEDHEDRLRVLERGDRVVIDTTRGGE